MWFRLYSFTLPRKCSKRKGDLTVLAEKSRKQFAFTGSLNQYNATWAKLQTLSFTRLNTKLLKYPNAENLYFNFIKEQNYFS